MTRDVRLYRLLYKSPDPIISEITMHPHGYILKLDIAIYKMWKGDVDGYLILSVSDDIDKIVEKHGAEYKFDLAIEYLRTNKNYFPLVFGESILADFIPYIIPNSGAFMTIKGASGKEYNFNAFNIIDKIRDNADGVYIFTITKPDERTLAKIDSHLLLSFSSIQHNNAEAIARAKENGAKHFLYYYSGAEHERQEIINDIKESVDYQYQVSNFSEVREGVA